MRNKTQPGHIDNANALIRQAQVYFVVSEHGTMNETHYRRMARTTARAAAEEARVADRPDLASWCDGCADVVESEIREGGAS